MEFKTEFEEFKQAVLDVAKELQVKNEDLEINVIEDGQEEFSYQAYGGSNTYYFQYFAKKNKSEKGADVLISISESSPPEDKMVSFEENVWAFKSFERVTGGALHSYNLKKHPVDLRNLFGRVPLYIFNIPNDEIKPQIEVILNGIPLGKGNELQVYKFRHVNKWQDYYRYYSYVFKFHTSAGSLLVAFPWLGALDSGGAHLDLDFADRAIKGVEDRGGIVKIDHYDIEYDKFENFISIFGVSITNHLTPELEVNQLRLPWFSAFGEEFENEWREFAKKFLERNFRDALGDIRSVVQDAMMITCTQKSWELPESAKRNPNSLVGVLIDKKVLDGKFREWTSAFTAFSNVGGHSRVRPSDEELDDPVVRTRVALVIMLGIQLIEELEKFLKPDKYR